MEVLTMMTIGVMMLGIIIIALTKIIIDLANNFNKAKEKIEELEHETHDYELRTDT